MANLGDKVFSSDVTINDVGIKIVVDGTGVPVAIDTVDPANNVPLPSALFQFDGTNYVPVLHNPVFVAVVDTAVNAVPVAGYQVGVLAADGVYKLEVASNANDITVEVNGTPVAAILAGSRVSTLATLQAGNIVLKSAVGADIDSGSISITILG